MAHHQDRDNKSQDRDNKSIKDGMKHLILCEGRDACNFLVFYLNSDVFPEHSEFKDCIQVEDFEGNEKLKSQMLLWSRAPGKERLETFVVIRDAETNAAGAIDSVKGAFRNANLPVPESPGLLNRCNSLATGFVLFPHCGTQAENGTLEDLCLSIIESTDSAVLSEIDLFLEKLRTQKMRDFPHEFKTRLHTYFSITDKLVSLKIGEAAKAGAFDWHSEKLNSLRDFLRSMVQNNNN